MSTNFFQNLNTIGVKRYVLDVCFSDGNVTVCVIPKNPSNDVALNNLPPFSITNSIEVVDNTFFEKITMPLQNTSLAFDNALRYQAQIEEKKKSTEENKAKSSAIEKLVEKLKKIMEESPLSEASKTKAKSFVLEIKKLDSKHKYALETEAKLYKDSLF